MRLTGKITVVLLGVIILFVDHSAARNRVYFSPDRKLRAVVVPIGKGKNKNSENRIDILEGRHALRSRTMSPSKGNPAETVRRGVWTDDSQYFIFNTVIAGKFAPKNQRTYYYDRANNHFFSLNDVVGPVIGEFFVVGHDSVSVTLYNRLKKMPDGDTAVVDLKLLPVAPSQK
jgi:hypothetical protein